MILNRRHIVDIRDQNTVGQDTFVTNKFQAIRSDMLSQIN